MFIPFLYSAGATQAGAMAPKTDQANSPLSDAEKLAQVMSGNLSGALSGGDKLLALSALLRSVSRGSQTTPQQAIAQIQQQKMGELQARMQIEQLRMQAARNAQMKAYREKVIAGLSPEDQARAQLLSDEQLTAGISKQVFPENYAPTESMRIAAELFPKGSPAYKAFLEAEVRRGKVITTPGGGVMETPGIGLERKVVTDKDGNQRYVAVIDGKPYFMD